MQANHEGCQQSSVAQLVYKRKEACEFSRWRTRGGVLCRHEDKKSDKRHLPAAAGEEPVPRVKEVPVHDLGHMQKRKTEEHLQSMDNKEHEQDVVWVFGIKRFDCMAHVRREITPKVLIQRISDVIFRVVYAQKKEKYGYETRRCDSQYQKYFQSFFVVCNRHLIVRCICPCLRAQDFYFCHFFLCREGVHVASVFSICLQKNNE